MSLIYQWIQKFTSVYNNDSDAPKPDIDVDSEGNFYVAYVCVNPPASGQTNVGLIDICVVKLNANGETIWFRQQPSFDTNQNDVDPSIAVDASGNIYVTYCTSGETSGQITTFITTAVVVFKLNSNGDTIWVKQSANFNVTGFNTAPVIDTDASGNVYVAYTSYDPAAVDYYDRVVLFKLDANGDTTWVQNTNTFNTPGGNYGPSLAVDDSGNCYVAYYCDGQAASGESLVGGYDIVVLKTDTNGNLTWIRQRPSFDTTGDDLRPSITVDTFGSLYAAYQTLGTASGQSTAGDTDVVVFKMDASGNVVWIKQNPTFNTAQADYGTTIGIDSLGMIYVAYSTTGITSGQTLTGTQDIAVMQMDNDGNLTTILQQALFNTAFENVYPSLAVDIQGNCGVVYYSVNPGIGDISSSQELAVFKLRNLVCVHGDTLILMADGSSKPIKEIIRGDLVAPNHQVARLCQERIDIRSLISLVVFEKNALGNRPDQLLIVTPNHPIFYKNARRPAKCFAKCPGVTMYESIPVAAISDLFTSDSNCIHLYDLQFDHDGSYIANGVEVQSRSPYSYCGPLSLDLYYDPLLYCEERVWDSMDHMLPLETQKLEFNLLMLKNTRHAFNEKQTANTVIMKQKRLPPVSIVKYLGVAELPHSPPWVGDPPSLIFTNPPNS